MTQTLMHVTVHASSSNAEQHTSVLLSATAQDDAALARLRQLMNESDIITRVPGRMGGSPIVDGLRVRVSDVVRQQRLLGDARLAFPFLTPIQVAAALTYYGSHRSEVEAEIAEEEALAAKCQPDSA
ncbi:MAG: DUF433 domain-containing protein [Dehalococcoidia bacterium]|nr:DUF433 domain-containing protein [Dehalococcoidia bacterium]